MCVCRGDAGTLTLLLLRHAPSDLNEEGRWNGQLDPPMSLAGRGIAIDACPRLLSALSNFSVVRIITSDLRRARETADVIAEALAIDEVLEEVGLRERDMGAWSGLSEEEAAAVYPSEYRAWCVGELAAPPGGESGQSIAIRALNVIGKWSSQEDGAVVVVTHAGVLRALAGVASSTEDRFPHLTGFWAHVDEAGNLMVGERYPG